MQACVVEFIRDIKKTFVVLNVAAVFSMEKIEHNIRSL